MTSRAKYCIQWESHLKQSFKGLCSLMEHQSLVDIVICCGNNTLHAHKCVLAASSSLFREELEKNLAIEQVIVSGCDFIVMKSIIEIIYCGETLISEEYVKYLAAAAKTFQMKGLENLFQDRNQYQFSGEEVFIPRPQFLSKKPKYPTAYHPFNNTSSLTAPSNILKPINYNLNDPYNQRRLKRRYVRTEAEKACAKEAQASRMALANLQKEIASAPQVNSFIIEESCTETTVENFIPHSEDLNEMQQIQVVDYSDINPVFMPSNQYMSDSKPQNMIQFSMHNTNSNTAGLTTDKIKHILGHDVPSNVEIMFKTSEGNFVSVTDEVLQNISKGGLQYQVVDENGHVGEIQELQVLGRMGEKREKMGEFNNTDASKMENGEGDISKMIPVSFINTNFLNNSQNIDSNPILNDQKIDVNSFDGDPVETIQFDAGSFSNSQFTLHNSSVYEDAKHMVNEADNQFYKLDDNLFISNLINNTNNNEGKKSDGDDKTDDDQSPRKNRSLKFSPDMFFADLPGEDEMNDSDSEVNDVVKLNRKKK